jgi:Kef-type K+ transport system membrane component KefB
LVVISLTLSFVSVGHGLAQSGRGDIGVLVTVNELLVVSSITIAAVLAIKQSLPPWWLFAGELVGVFLAFCLWQPYWVTRRLNLNGHEWFRNTLMPAGAVLLLCMLFAYLMGELLPPGIFRAAVVAIGTICISPLLMWTGSLRADEKEEVRRILNRRRLGWKRRRG